MTLRDLKVSWGGLQTLSYGLLQFYGHGSWLVCEVALRCFIIDLLMQHKFCCVNLKSSNLKEHEK